MTLTDKEQMFISEYLRCWNGAEAARRAGYSAISARSIASENLTKPNIRAEIERRMKDAAMSADEVLARLSDQARGSLKPFTAINEDGFAYFDFSSDEAKENFHLIKEIRTKRSRRVEGKGDDAEVWEDELIEVKIHDPQKALDLLAKYHRLYVERFEVNHTLNVEGLQEILDRAYARKEAAEADQQSKPTNKLTSG